MCACIMCVLLYVCMHACMCVYACMYVSCCVYVCMHTCVCVCMYVCMCIHVIHNQSSHQICGWGKKQSPTLSLGSKHQYPNIFHEKLFTPNHPNISPDTCQYLSWTIHALVNTFEALIKYADAKRKQSPTLSLGSKHPYLNIFHEHFFTPNQPNLSPNTG